MYKTRQWEGREDEETGRRNGDAVRAGMARSQLYRDPSQCPARGRPSLSSQAVHARSHLRQSAESVPCGQPFAGFGPP